MARLRYGDTLIRHLSCARSCVDPSWRGYVEMMKEMWERSGLLSGENTSLEWMSHAMRRYHDEVQRTVPAERLLVWTPADGWDPICEFLEVPMPAEPFPYVNDSTAFKERIVEASLLAIQSSVGSVREGAGALAS